MAMIDYGAIAFKNDKLISTGFFTPMAETCGFSDATNKLPETYGSFDGNYFVVLGNKKFIIGFYKNGIAWWVDNSNAWCADSANMYDNNEEPFYEIGHEWFDNAYGFIGWKSWNKYIGDVDVTVKPRHGYYQCTFKLGNDKYKVYFGFGVDLDWYKKTHLVDYYSTCPKVWIRNIKYWIKDTIENIRYKNR